MLYVYYGYCSSDNYDASEGPTYKIKECRTAEDVAAFKEQFDECIHDECINIVFRVFDGIERHLKPHETVTHWKLE